MARRWLDLMTGSGWRPTPLTRRELLRRGMVAGAGLLSGQSFASSLLQRSRPRVIVVGAGFAGLACAYELKAAGYNVHVWEARKRVGGRIHSLRELSPGKVVEGGGEMLGSNHPHVLAYAAKFKFELDPVIVDEGVSPTIVGGMRLTAAQQEQAATEIAQALIRMTEAARAVVVDEPWLTPQAKQLDQLSTAGWIDRLEMSPTAKALMTVQFTATNGVATEKQSYLGNLAQVCGGGLEKYWTDTEVYRLKGGNVQYAERMATELGRDVYLNCPVREITTTEKAVIVVNGEGERYEADDVVLAIPPSVWSTIKFSPGLPAVLNPQMGKNIKYLSVMKERFWRAAGLTSRATTDHEVQQTWEATDSQADVGPFVLTAFSGGPAAEAVCKRPVPERQPAYLKAMEQLYPGFTEQFVKGQFMDWPGDPWTRGAYSFPAPGQVTTVGPALQAGLGRLHFAGEHTCYKFVGYMEGALTSGATLAKRLATRDGIVN